MLNFERINTAKSKDIIDSLMKGQMINEKVYCGNSNSMIDNGLFNELLSEKDAYSFYFKMGGFTLMHKSNYFYLYEENDKNDKQKTKKRICAAVIILVRYITHNKGKLYEYMTNHHYGIKPEDLENIDKDDNFIPIFQNAFHEVKKEYGKYLLDFLSNKNLLFKTNTGRYIFSDSAISLIEEYKNIGK